MTASAMPEVGRLRRRPEFLRVASKGRKWATPGLVLQAWRRVEEKDAAAPARVGFTASRKVGSAVERNRARRRLKALAAELLPEAGRAGTDYVVIARAATVKRPFPLLRQDFALALEAVEPRTAAPATGRPAGREGEEAEKG